MLPVDVQAGDSCKEQYARLPPESEDMYGGGEGYILCMFCPAEGCCGGGICDVVSQCLDIRRGSTVCSDSE